MAGEGAILKKTREEKGFSFQDVESVTKIRVKYLEALENEEYKVLPGATYTKGFLRNYARFLGLDQEEIINLYNLSFQTKLEDEEKNVPVPLEPVRTGPNLIKPAVVILIALILAAIIYAIFYLGKGDSDLKNSNFNPTPLPSAPQVESPADQNPPPGNAQPPAGAQEFTGIVAELSFTQKCWISVRVDGQKVDERAYQAGERKVYEGKERIEFVSIGNAGGVTISLNGTQVDPLGAPGEVVRNIVVTEETIRQLATDKNIVPVKR